MVTALRNLTLVQNDQPTPPPQKPSRSMDVWIRGDLLASKPRRAMGEAIWLYLYLKSRAGFETGQIDRYSHSDAAEYLDASDRTIRGWMERLINLGYVTVTHHRYYLTVEITNFVPQSIRVAERRRPQAGMDPEPPPAPSPAESCRPNLPSPAESCRSESARTAESCRKDGRILPSVRSNVSSNDPGRDLGDDKDLGGGEDPPLSPPPIRQPSLIDPELPESVQALDRLLTGQRGYSPTWQFLDKIAREYAGLDLESEAFKMLDWLAQPKNRARLCSFSFILNWLKRAQADATIRTLPATPRPPEIEDGETYYRRLLATGQPNGDDPRE